MTEYETAKFTALPNERNTLNTGRPRKFILTGFLLVGITAIAITPLFLQVNAEPRKSRARRGITDTLNFFPPSPMPLRAFKGGAVCSDGGICAEVGKNILGQNGSAVDAAIATMMCNGMVSMQNMNLGGGFMMTIYNRQSQTSSFLVARDRAPLAASADMYDGKPASSTRSGPLAIAVPGEIAGYQAAHARFGNLAWEDLFTPNIELCQRGWPITKALYEEAAMKMDKVRGDPTIKKILVDPKTDRLKSIGSIVTSESFCETLKLLQAKGAGEFYNGTLGQTFIEDLRNQGSILTMEDLNLYQPLWKDVLRTELSDGTRVFTPNLPSSGALLSFILNVLDEFKFTSESLKGFDNTILTYHRIIETWKYAYAKRSKMGDDLFVDMTGFVRNLTSRDYAKAVHAKISDERTWNDPAHYGAGETLHSDHGTAQISVLAPNGDAVSVTSSINTFYGSGIVSARTGIVGNSGMDDFAVPGVINHYNLPGGNTNNLVEPMKRPMSSMVPSILVSPDGDVRMIIGGAGGTKITSSVSFAIARHLWMNETIKEALDASRIHHQLFPMEVGYEFGVPQAILTGLKKLGHRIPQYYIPESVLCGITKSNGIVYGSADFRISSGDVYGTDEITVLPS